MGVRFKSHFAEKDFQVALRHENETDSRPQYADWLFDFDFSEMQEKEFYLLCARPECADAPVLAKLKCVAEKNKERYYLYRFECMVVEIEGIRLSEEDQAPAVKKSDCLITAETQMRILREALTNKDIQGNPIKVSDNYISEHLSLVRIKQTMQRRIEKRR